MNSIVFTLFENDATHNPNTQFVSELAINIYDAILITQSKNCSQGGTMTTFSAKINAKHIKHFFWYSGFILFVMTWFINSTTLVHTDTLGMSTDIYLLEGTVSEQAGDRSREISHSVRKLSHRYQTVTLFSSVGLVFTGLVFMLLGFIIHKYNIVLTDKKHPD